MRVSAGTWRLPVDPCDQDLDLARLLSKSHVLFEEGARALNSENGDALSWDQSWPVRHAYM